jgi:hypothetical protein
MENILPDLIIKHSKIERPDSSVWNLTPLVYEGGNKSLNEKLNSETTKNLKKLTIKNHQINYIKEFKDHAEAMLDSGVSEKTLIHHIKNLKKIFCYLDESGNRFDSIENIRKTLYEYSEHEYTRANLKKIKHQSAYDVLISISMFLNGVFEDLKFEIGQTRLKKQKLSKRVYNRETEKIILSHARQLAKFCFEITQNFEPSILRRGVLPILLEANNQQINLTAARRHRIEVESDFTKTNAYLAFNYRVTAELFIFLGMTVQNQAPSYNIKRITFAYKPIGEIYEVREFKNRRGGEAIFKIPRPYKPYFEKYLSFLDEYAPDSQWLFPHLEKGKGFRKRTDSDINKFARICSRYEIPWVKPSAFRKIGENILMRLASDEKTASDYANHAVATFRQYYEFPSLQRSMIEIGRFWSKVDPLIDGKPTVSLFSSPCNGIPIPIDDATNKLPKPDCITPTGCIGCKHYRDEESFDYVWGLLSFKFLKIIESSSFRVEEQKPSNIAIDWVNLKTNWFKNSEKSKHQEWVKEAEIRIEESDYHPSWARKIEKYEA